MNNKILFILSLCMFNTYLFGVGDLDLGKSKDSLNSLQVGIASFTSIVCTICLIIAGLVYMRDPNKGFEQIKNIAIDTASTGESYAECQQIACKMTININ